MRGSSAFNKMIIQRSHSFQGIIIERRKEPPPAPPPEGNKKRVAPPEGKKRELPFKRGRVGVRLLRRVGASHLSPFGGGRGRFLIEVSPKP